MNINNIAKSVAQFAKKFSKTSESKVRQSSPTVYVVEGDRDTEYEGLVFAVCTTKEKAENALNFVPNRDEIIITEVITNCVLTDDGVTLV